MNTLPIPINHPALKGRSVKSWVWEWPVDHVFHNLLPTMVRTRYQYLKIELSDGTLLKFTKDTITNDIYLDEEQHDFYRRE